jgi:peptidoglycan-N-acetylglucosamine deacetylase
MNPWLMVTPAIAGAFASLAAYGAVHPRSQMFGATLCTTAHPRQLALSFDDGPNPSITPKLLDLLDRYNAKATFFVVGKYVRAAPALTNEIVVRGHVLGNHTDSHPNLFFCGPAETRAELIRCSEAIHHATWLEPRWFRPPFGFRSPWLSEITHQQRLRTVMWTLIPGDWRNKSVTWLTGRMQPVADRARQNLPHAPSTSASPGKPASPGSRRTPHGDILCLHDGYHAQPNGDRTRTLAALEFWLPRWRDLGLEFVTISEAEGKAVEA